MTHTPRSYSACKKCGKPPRSTRHVYCLDCTPAHVWAGVERRAKAMGHRDPIPPKFRKKFQRNPEAKPNNQIPMTDAEVLRIIEEGDRRAGWPVGER